MTLKPWRGGFLKWMVQCHKDVHKNSRLRLEYAYLIFHDFKINSVNPELIKKVLDLGVVFDYIK